jgi:hypothetical protein
MVDRQQILAQENSAAKRPGDSCCFLNSVSGSGGLWRRERVHLAKDKDTKLIMQRRRNELFTN